MSMVSQAEDVLDQDHQMDFSFQEYGIFKIYDHNHVIKYFCWLKLPWVTQTIPRIGPQIDETYI